MAPHLGQPRMVDALLAVEDRRFYSHAGIDVREMYPAGSPPKADNWTLDTFLKSAEACHRGGVPFGIGLGETGESNDTCGAIFQSFGAQLVDGKVGVHVKMPKEIFR